MFPGGPFNHTRTAQHEAVLLTNNTDVSQRPFQVVPKLFYSNWNISEVSFSPPPPLVTIPAFSSSTTLATRTPSEDVKPPKNSYGFPSSFAGLRNSTEYMPKKPMHLIIKGCFLWIADHIILGTPCNSDNHFHLLTITRADPRRNNETPQPDTFYLIDCDQLLTYKKSSPPHQPDLQPFSREFLIFYMKNHDS